MDIRIKKGFLTWTLLDEKNRPVAKIRNKRLIGSNKIVSDQAGRITYTTKVEKNELGDYKPPHIGHKKYVVYENNNPIMTAWIKFIPNPDKHKNRACSLLPREIDSMELDTPYGQWIVQRHDDNLLKINMNGEHLGSVICNSSFKPNRLISFKNYPTTFWAGIYTLIHYMRCEEYFIMV